MLGTIIYDSLKDDDRVTNIRKIKLALQELGRLFDTMNGRDHGKVELMSVGGNFSNDNYMSSLDRCQVDKSIRVVLWIESNKLYLKMGQFVGIFIGTIKEIDKYGLEALKRGRFPVAGKVTLKGRRETLGELFVKTSMGKVLYRDREKFNDSSKTLKEQINE